MRTFLLKNNKPIIKWGLLQPNIRYKGLIPKDYDLAINPNSPYIIVDVDKHSEDKDGFVELRKLSLSLQAELTSTFNYPTKHNGRHFWFYYTGDKVLMNKASSLGIDLRIGYTQNSKGKITHNGGYIKWHPRDTYTIEEVLDQINLSSKEMNEWLEKIFS